MQPSDVLWFPYLLLEESLSVTRERNKEGGAGQSRGHSQQHDMMLLEYNGDVINEITDALRDR
jgi:hypothetical protein